MKNKTKPTQCYDCGKPLAEDSPTYLCETCIHARAPHEDDEE
jgi:hypothetical protein